MRRYQFIMGISFLIMMTTFSCGKEEKTNNENYVAVTAITDLPTVIEVNKPTTLSATVLPSNATRQNIIWTIKNAGTTGASITNGKIITAKAKGTVTITASIAGGSSVTSPFTTDIDVKVKNAGEMPTITDVAINPSNVDITIGDSYIFTAVVNGTNLEEEDKTVTWTVSGGTKTETIITTNGELTIAEDETATSLTVKAISVLDNSKNATAIVTVDKQDDSPYAEYFGTWRVVMNDNTWDQITISANKVVWLSINGEGVTINNLNWTEKNNPGGEYTSEYPIGYRITGIITSMNNYTNIPKVNDSALISFYISNDKKSIRAGNWLSTSHEAIYGPYDKKLNVEYWQITWNLNGGTWPASDNHPTKGAKDGKLAHPNLPSKKGYIFDGWYKESSFIDKVIFPYDLSSVTSNFTLYAKWKDATPSAKLSVTKLPGGGFYTSISVQVQTSNGGWGSYIYRVSTDAGTSVIDVVPGTYRFYVTYWACQTVNCMSSGWSSSFSVSKGQTKNISIVGSSIAT